MFDVKLKCLVITRDVRSYDDIKRIIDRPGLNVKLLEFPKTDADVSAKLKHADLAIYDLDSASISLILKLSMMLKQNLCFMFKHTKIETTTSYNKKEVTVVNLKDEVHENLIDWIKKAKHRVIIWRWKIGLLFTLAITLLVYALVDCRKQNAQDRCCQTQEDFGPRGQETQYCCFWPPTLYLKVLGRDKTHNDRRYRPEDWGRGPYYRPGP